MFSKCCGLKATSEEKLPPKTASRTHSYSYLLKDYTIDGQPLSETVNKPKQSSSQIVVRTLNSNESTQANDMSRCADCDIPNGFRPCKSKESKSKIQIRAKQQSTSTSIKPFLEQDINKIRARNKPYEDPYFIKTVSSIVENTESQLYLSLKTRLKAKSLKELNTFIKWNRTQVNQVFLFHQPIFIINLIFFKIENSQRKLEKDESSKRICLGRERVCVEQRASKCRLCPILFSKRYLPRLDWQLLSHRRNNGVDKKRIPLGKSHSQGQHVEREY